MLNIRRAINPFILISTVLIVLLGGYWLWTKNNTTIEAGWRTYRNDKLGVSLNYPEGWYIQDKTDQENPYLSIRNYDIYPTFMPGTQYPELPDDFQVISISIESWSQFIDNDCQKIKPDKNIMKPDSLIDCLKANERDEAAQLLEYKYVGELKYANNIYQLITYQPVDFGKQFILFTINLKNKSVISIATRLNPTNDETTQKILGSLKT